VVSALALALMSTPSAWAHAGGLSPAGVRSVVRTVSPAVPGLTVSTIEDGARLLVRNDTGSALEIPAGGGQADPISVPAGESLTWIDGRATTLERDLGTATTAPWSIAMTWGTGTVPVTVTGQFVAEPAPGALAWWAGTAAIGVAVVALLRRSRQSSVLLAAAGLVTVLASLVHVVGSTMAVESAPRWGTFLDATGIGLLVWPLVVMSAVAALRGKTAGVLGVCAGAGLSVVFILPDITVFHFAVLPFAGPAFLERLLVAMVLGVGSATAVAGAGALRSLATRQLPAPAEPHREIST
jgi:hypothetical protein